jgi:hypothetical protein
MAVIHERGAPLLISTRACYNMEVFSSWCWQ